MEPLLISMTMVGAPTLVGGAAAAAAWLALYPPVPRDLGGARDLDDEAEKVTIPLADDDALSGWYLPGNRGVTLLLLHGYGRTHHRMWRYAGFLRAAGYGALAIDFRSSRRGRRLPTTLGHHEREDVEAAWRWLKRRVPNDRLGVMGESLGGSVALMLAADHPDAEMVVVDCPFATGSGAVDDMLVRFLRLPRWPFVPMVRRLGILASGHDPCATDVVECASRLRERRVLFIHSEEDERVAPRHSERLWEAAGGRHPLWRVPNARHNRAWIAQREEYERRVLDFLAGDPAA
ncbi:MAG TPA: alpha/beta fold hydrolase [Candidatus Eisenbacteria bacterium]|nr:alpha/beta fold hydrolase [Candidatus Eisenbacteria bacterium]